MKLEEFRIKQDMKIREVAEYLSCNYTTYYRYEKELRQPSWDILSSLAQLYGVTVDDLVGKKVPSVNYQDDLAASSNAVLTANELETEMVYAFRTADPRAQADAIKILREHPNQTQN